MAWTTTDLIASVKRRASIPTAQSFLGNADFLAIANEEMSSYIVPLVVKEREDFWLAHEEQPLLDGVARYPLPYRGIGGALREILLLDGNRNPTNVPRLDPSDLVEPDFGFFMDGEAITIVSNEEYERWTSWTTLRLSFYLRPNQLVETTSAATVTVVGASDVTLTGIPAAFSGATQFDVIAGRPPFSTRGYDRNGTLAGSTLTFDAGLPPNVTVGDYVCLPEQSPVPQIPAELHGLLAQKVAVKVLEAKGMGDKLASAREELTRMEADARALLSPRVDGEALRVVSRGSLFRLRW